MQDFSLRAQQVISKLDVLYCEDTRTTRKLLNLAGLSVKTSALSDDHGQSRWDDAVQQVLNGKQVGYASDAGMPGISDPARKLTRAAWEKGIAPIVIPGPSAVGTLVSAAPFVNAGFRFAGFAPRKAGELKQFVDAIAAEHDPTVFFEGPSRAESTIDLLSETLEPDREILIGRELTKMYEQLMLCTAGDWAKRSSEITFAGEFTIAVSGSTSTSEPGDDEVLAAASRLYEAGYSKSEAAKAIAAMLDMKPNAVKKLLLSGGK